MITNLQGLKLAATGLQGLFAGNALYINMVEHRARNEITHTPSFLQEWKASFKYCATSAPVLGATSLACCAAIWYLDKDCPPETRYLWLSGIIIFPFVGAYTYFVMIPDIRRLHEKDVIEKKGEDWVREKITVWNKQHMVRTFFNTANFVCCLIALLKSS